MSGKTGKHTPGPFTLTENGTVNRNEMVIARVFQNAAVADGGPVEKLPWRENGALFVASPQLLYACENAKTAMEAAWQLVQKEIMDAETKKVLEIILTGSAGIVSDAIEKAKES